MRLCPYLVVICGAVPVSTFLNVRFTSGIVSPLYLAKASSPNTQKETGKPSLLAKLRQKRLAKPSTPPEEAKILVENVNNVKTLSSDLDDLEAYLEDDSPPVLRSSNPPRSTSRPTSGSSNRGKSTISDSDLAEIEMLLQKRAEYRASYDYELADDMRDELQSRFGVSAYDKKGFWTAPDGTQGTLPIFKSSANMSKYAGAVLGPEEMEDIDRLVQERTMYRSKFDYENADRLKDDLFKKYGLKLHDREGIWEARDGTTGQIATRIGQKCSLTEDEILQQVHERTMHRRKRNFEAADKIRTYLEKNGVELEDRQDKWRAVDGSLSGYQFVPQNTAPCLLSVEEIQSMAEIRTDCRRRGDFKEADRLRDELIAKGVKLFDATNEWMSLDGKLKGMQSNDW